MQPAKKPNDTFAIPSQKPQNTRDDSSRQREATTELLLKQINSIYESDPKLSTPSKPAEKVTEEAPKIETKQQSITQSNTHDKYTTSKVKPGPGAVRETPKFTPAPKPSSPYERTLGATTYQLDNESLKKYHTAWQDYYQKYYERYYMGQVNNIKDQVVTKSTRHQNVTESKVSDEEADYTISTDEAMSDLRDKIRHTIKKQTSKIRKSRHFIPIAAASFVMIIFLFLQYNRVVFAAVDAYVSPGNIDPAALMIDPTAAGEISTEPRLMIPKINVNVPIIWDANAADQNSLNAAMDKGVAWFNMLGANARPGEVGNFVLSGHSSNDWLDQGDYKFIFVRLEQLAEGDTIYVDYNQIRYIYTVTKHEVVKPTDVAALTTPTDKPIITLITCTPIGTALNRLLVTAEQVSPDPIGAPVAESDPESASATKMPANSPTFIERIFGGGN